MTEKKKTATTNHKKKLGKTFMKNYLNKRRKNSFIYN